MVAAESGLPEYQNEVGALYAEGLGAPQDHVEALKWYAKAAESDYPYAQANIG